MKAIEQFLKLGKKYQERECLFISVLNGVLDILAEVSFNDWWETVFFLTEEEREKVLCLAYQVDTPSQIRIKEEIIKIQGIYNSLKRKDIRLETEEKEVLKVAPVDSGIVRFLKGKTNLKPNLTDLWMHFCFIKWILIKWRLATLPLINSTIEVNELGEYNSLLDQFASEMISVDRANVISTKHDLNNILKPLVLYSTLQNADGEDIKCLYCLLDYYYGVLKKDHIDIDEARHRFNAIKAQIGQSTIVLKEPTQENWDDNKRESIQEISMCIKRFFSGICIDDYVVEKLYMDIPSIVSGEQSIETIFSNHLSKTKMFLKQLMTKQSTSVFEQLYYLFVLMNSYLISNKEREIVDLFRKYPLLCRIVQRQYDVFLGYNKYAKEIDFLPNKPKLLPEDLIWSGTRDNNCFHLHYTSRHLQNLYDYLINNRYIDRNTDIKVFAHTFTGFPLNEDIKCTPINWIHKEKQSLAMLIGLIKERKDSCKLTWKSASKLFTWNGKELLFPSSTQYRQVLKSGKYEDLVNIFNSVESLKTSGNMEI